MSIDMFKHAIPKGSIVYYCRLKKDSKMMPCDSKCKVELKDKDPVMAPTSCLFTGALVEVMEHEWRKKE